MIEKERGRGKRRVVTNREGLRARETKIVNTV